MRALPVPLLLVLLSPVPGRGGECPPCPRGVPEPCDSRCPPCTRTRSPAEEEPEEPCPPCLPCTHEAAAPLPEGTPPVSGDPRVTLPVSGDPRVTPPVSGAPPEPPPGDIIPLYCALLAALVVGLVAYVAFKCWDTCRKKRQLDKARDTGEAGDVEKLRGDGGLCSDSAGLETAQHPSPEGPRGRQEEPGELERLLELGAPGGERRGPGPAAAPGDVTSAV